MLAAAARLGGDFQPAQLKRMQVRCFAWGAAVAQAGWLAGCGGAEASCVQLGGGRGMDRSCAGPGLSSQIQHAVLRHITPLVAARPRGQADGAAGRAAAAVFGGRCGRVQGGWPGGRACSGVCGGGEGQTTGLSWVPACAQPALLFHLHAQPAAPLPPTPPPLVPSRSRWLWRRRSWPPPRTARSCCRRLAGCTKRRQTSCSGVSLTEASPRSGGWRRVHRLLGSGHVTLRLLRLLRLFQMLCTLRGATSLWGPHHVACPPAAARVPPAGPRAGASRRSCRLPAWR